MPKGNEASWTPGTSPGKLMKTISLESLQRTEGQREYAYQSGKGKKSSLKGGHAPTEQVGGMRSYHKPN